LQKLYHYGKMSSVGVKMW